MYESRTISPKKKLKIVLDKRFKEFFSYRVGNKGQGFLKGSIFGEKLEDETDCLIKMIEISSIEIISENPNRL